MRHHGPQGNRISFVCYCRHVADRFCKIRVGQLVQECSHLVLFLHPTLSQRFKRRQATFVDEFIRSALPPREPDSIAGQPVDKCAPNRSIVQWTGSHVCAVIELCHLSKNAIPGPVAVVEEPTIVVDRDQTGLTHFPSVPNWRAASPVVESLAART